FRVALLSEPQAVQLRQIVEHPAAGGRAEPGRIREIEHAVAAAAELYTLMLGRQKPASPEPIIKRLATFAGCHGDKGRQIVGLTAQTVGKPGPQAGPSGKLTARLQEGD